MKKSFKKYEKAGLPGGPNELKRFTNGFIVSERGQWDYPGQPTAVPTPSGKITTEGVEDDLIGIDNLGNTQYMTPNNEYQFEGDMVYEIPQAKKGGSKKPSKKYSRSLMAKNRLFSKNPLLKKIKSAKNKIYDPYSPYFQPGGEIEYNQLPKNYQDALKNFVAPEVINLPEETDTERYGYDAALGVIYQNPNDPIENMNNPWWGEHELFHHLQNQAGAMSTYGTVGQRPNPYVASDEAIGSYYDRRGSEFDIELNKIFEQNPDISEEEAYTIAEENLYRNPTSVEGEARNYEGYIEAGNPSMFPKKQQGGFMDVELDDSEIEEYRKGGYIVEDISVPSLTRMQFAGEVPDSTYTPIDPNFLAENPDTYSKIVNKPEVESERQGSDIGKLRAEFREKNPMDIFLDEKKRQFLKKNKGLNKAAGNNMEKFPEDVLQNFIKEYEYKTNTYAVNKLGKKEGWNPKRRGEWVDELTPGEKEAVAESKYGSKLQPSYWSRSLAGLQELGNEAIKLLPGEQGDVMKFNIPGLTKKEQKEIRESKMGALETLAPIDIPGAAIANLAKNTGLSTGSDYKEQANALAGEKMANVSDTDAMALNPLTYAGLESLPELGVNLAKGLGKGANKLQAFVKNARDMEKIAKAYSPGLTTMGYSASKPAVNFVGPMRAPADAVGDVLTGLRKRGAKWDQAGAKGEELLHSDMINYHGTYSGRPIVEVRMPDGTPEFFYKSSGWAGKEGAGLHGTTEGMWQPFGGFSDTPATKNWFIKDKGYKDYYGSNTFKTMAENLDNALMQKLGFQNTDELENAFNFQNRNANVDSYTPIRKYGGTTAKYGHSVGNLIRKDDGGSVSGTQGLTADFSQRLTQMILDARAQGIDLGVGSGYRSYEKQKRLWEQALKKYGSPEKARKWVAPPGGSFHNKGLAVDLNANGQFLGKDANSKATEWAHANAKKYGLHFRMGHEPWHIEPIEKTKSNSDKENEHDHEHDDEVGTFGDQPKPTTQEEYDKMVEDKNLEFELKQKELAERERKLHDDDYSNWKPAKTEVVDPRQQILDQYSKIMEPSSQNVFEQYNANIQGQMKDGGFIMELTDKEIERYRKGGFIIEELD